MMMRMVINVSVWAGPDQAPASRIIVTNGDVVSAALRREHLPLLPVTQLVSQSVQCCVENMLKTSGSVLTPSISRELHTSGVDKVTQIFDWFLKF